MSVLPVRLSPLANMPASAHSGRVHSPRRGAAGRRCGRLPDYFRHFLLLHTNSMSTVREDGENEREVRHSIDAGRPQSDEDAVTGRLQRRSDRPAVQLATVVGGSRPLVDLNVRLVAQDGCRHLVLPPTDVDLEVARPTNTHTHVTH